MAPLDPTPRLEPLVKRPRQRSTRDLVRRADVAAVGFAVSLPGSGTIRLTITRQRNGKWRVVSDSELRGVPEELRQRAISLSAAVICGANLFGNLVTELDIKDEVRWVSISRLEEQGTNPSIGRYLRARTQI